MEGIEGCGKSTQAEKLGVYLQKQGYPLEITREPGGTALGNQIRKLLLCPQGIGIAAEAELFLYAADRAQHLQEVILPALETGKVVICDRFTDATLAYQGYARGINQAIVAEINQFVTQGLKPDLTLLLDFEVSQGLARALGRNQQSDADKREDRFEQEGDPFHQRVRQGYLALARTEPGRIKVIDAGKSAEEIHNDILAEVLPVLRGKQKTIKKGIK